MNLQQQIAHKEFDGYSLFRVYDLLNNEVVNIRAVRENDGNFELAMDINKNEEEFMFGTGISELYTGPDYENVIQTLRDSEENTAKNLKSILKATSGIDMERTDLRVVAGHVYAISLQEEMASAPQIQFAFGDTNGRIIYHGPIPNDEGIVKSIKLGLVNNRFLKKGDQVFQTGVNEYLIIAKHKEITILVPAMLQEEEDGMLSWVSSIDLIEYVGEDEEGHTVLIGNSDKVFESSEEAQTFLKEKTAELTKLLVQ